MSDAKLSSTAEAPALAAFLDFAQTQAFKDAIDPKVLAERQWRGALWVAFEAAWRTVERAHSDPAVIRHSDIRDLQQAALMIRTWIPEVYLADADGRVSFARAIMESVATTIERAVEAAQEAGAAQPSQGADHAGDAPCT